MRRLKQIVSQKYYSWRFFISYKAEERNNAVFCFHGFKYSFCGKNYGQSSRNLVGNVLSAVRKKFKIVSLPELIEETVRLPIPIGSQPRAAFTIDDGFSSTLDVLDIFKEFSTIPTVFVCPDLMESNTLPFPEIVKLGFILTDKCSFFGPNSEEAESITNLNERINMTRRWVEHFKQVHYDNLRSELDALLEKLMVCKDTIREYKHFDPLLTFGQLREMRPFIHIGSHTCNHLQLSSQPDENSMQEILASKGKIESELSIECKSLAYPFGNYSAFGRREVEYAESCGYEAAFSLERGYIQKGDMLYELPRINIGGGFKYMIQSQSDGYL